MRTYGTKKMLIATLLLGGPSLSIAELPDYPGNSNILHDQSGARNSILMDCSFENRDTGKISCQFFQMSVSYALNPDEYESKLDEELHEIRSPDFVKNEDLVAGAKKACDVYLEGKSEFDKKIDMAKGSGKEGHQRLVRELLAGACDLKTEEAAKEFFEKLVQISLDWETKTCKVWPNSWEETFTPEYTNDGFYWLSKSVAHGECGVLNVSTLKKDGDYFWKYESRRIVTNKEGGGGLIECSHVEERTAIYSWRSKEHLVNCREIKFEM